MEETLKTYYQIITDIWKMLKDDLRRLEPTEDYLDATYTSYVIYENQWRDSEYWAFAGHVCAAALEEINRIWKERRKQK